MKLGFTPEEERFRAEAAAWLTAALTGPFATLRGVTGLTARPDERRAWEQALGRARWSVPGWPREHGGRGATLAEQVIFAEECARAGAPARLGHVGVELIGPTILAFGSEAQKARFLPPIAAGEEYWCQGYSEPNAGSDLANVRTRARLEDGALGDRRAEDVDLARAVRGLGLRPVPDHRGQPGPRGTLFPAGAHEAGRRDRPPDPADDRRHRVQRALLRGRAHRGGQRPRHARRRLGGGHGAAQLRARRLDARAADGLPWRACAHVCARGEKRRGPRPAHPAAPRRGTYRAHDHARERSAHAHRRRIRSIEPRGVYLQALLGELAPQTRRARDGYPGSGRARSRRPRNTGSTSSRTCTCTRAQTRSTAAPTRSSAT